MANFGFGVGIPTKVDVDRLLEEFGVPEPGTEIPYADVERILRLAKNTHRFRTVTHAWRAKIEREHNLVCEGIANKGFRFLTNKEMPTFTTRQFKAGVRKSCVAGRRAAATSRAGLDAGEVRVLDHVSNVAAQFRVQAALEARKMRELAAAPEVGKK